MDTARVFSVPSTASAADRVYAHVRGGILGRRYTEADLLSEGRLAEETGVSRTPVREALLRLEAEGMVRLLPKRGALVVGVSAQEWRDVIATRRLVESHCVGVVIEAGRGPTVAGRLTEQLDRLESAAATGDVSGYVSADRDFHAAIVAGAGNGILTRLYRSLRDRQLLMGATNLLADNGFPDRDRINSTIVDHRAIADAVRSEDLEVALQLTHRHLATAERMLATH